MGAEVVLDSSSTRRVGTNVLGVFVIPHVSEGQHAIRIRGIGYRPLFDSVIVDPRGTAHLEYEMTMDSPEGVCLEFFPSQKPE